MDVVAVCCGDAVFDQGAASNKQLLHVADCLADHRPGVQFVERAEADCASCLKRCLLWHFIVGCAFGFQGLFARHPSDDDASVHPGVGCVVSKARSVLMEGIASVLS